MTRLSLRRREETPELEPYFQAVEQRTGFIPNSQLVMAHKPGLLKAFAALRQAIYDREARIPRQLMYMVGHMASLTAGCRYCMAHTASNAARSDAADEKIAAIWEYETSELFTDAERAALRFAQGAASAPNAVTDEDMAALKKHFDEVQILEILSVVCWFGFLNRFNDSLAMELEEEPHAIAERVLAARGWRAGKHAAAE